MQARIYFCAPQQSKKTHTTMHKNAHFMIAHNHKSPDKLNMQATRHEVRIYYARQ